MDDVADFVLAREPVIRFSFFVGVLIVMMGWEGLEPRRRRAVSRWSRWPNNLGIAAFNTLAMRFLLPTAAAGFAVMAETRGWGLLNNIALPEWVKIVTAIALLDLAIYLQHVTFHAVPILWRLHRMHHTDLDLDVTSGARFHPLEIVLSMALKIALVVALGAPAVAVVVFEVALNAASMFNHANIGLPKKLDGMLRWLVVTPDMHRVHHSILPNETNSNFGFLLPWWDRVVGTYRAQPMGGHNGMTIGLDIFRDPAQLRIDRMLAQPFIGPAGTHPVRWRRSL